MKILVTGGAGFIGSHIVDAYVRLGHKVAILDNLATGFRRNVNPHATVFRADIRDEKKVRVAVRKFQPEIISHHAAFVEVGRALREPLEVLNVNVLGTANILLAFGEESRAKRKKFIFASTGGTIYGDPKKIPVAETAPPDPLSAYPLSKHLGEELVRRYAKTYKFEYLTLRYANVYGPRQNPKAEAGVVAIFGGLLKAGKQPTIFGDGKKTRDYVYVEDIAHANALALTKGKNMELNIGWGKEVSDQDMFDAIARSYGYKGKPKYAPFRKGETLHISLDARKAKRVLGWTPRTRLNDGIAKALRAL